MTLEIDMDETDEKELEDDEQRLDQEREHLGMLYYQKETRNFTEWVNEIEDITKKECQKIYTGEKSKLLTGSDNIPDYLRLYLANLKNNAENFRIQSARLLRNSAEELGVVSKKINDMVISYIELLHHYKTVANITQIEDGFQKVHQENLIMPSHKSCKIKIKLGKAMKCNRQLPQWVRMRTGNTVRYNKKQRHWRRTKLGF